jgi:hypothetical protein
VTITGEFTQVTDRPRGNETGFEEAMAEEVREPGTITRIGLVAGDGFDMTGVHKEHCQQAGENVEDGFPVHPRTLDGDLGTARVDEPIR